jgi:hypothetical protein
MKHMIIGGYQYDACTYGILHFISLFFVSSCPFVVKLQP